MPALYTLLLLASAILATAGEECKEGHFQCSSGECWPMDLRCNGWGNCPDGDDEENCKDYVCPDNKFKCSSHECIDKGNRCDANYDCSDGSDEENCEDFECEEGMFHCSSGQCIRPEFQCDGEYDCSDSSDEEDCQDFDCPDSSHECTTGQCISHYRKCDGRQNCPDKSDELNCTTSDDVEYLDPNLSWDQSTMKHLGWVPMGENCCVACASSHEETTMFIVYKFAKYGVYCRCLKPSEGEEPTAMSKYKIYGGQGYTNKTVAKMIELPWTTAGSCGVRTGGPCENASQPELHRSPEVFQVQFDTDIADQPIVVEVNRTLAPNGADRFYDLVIAGFFNTSAFFRVVPGFVLQFGISGDPCQNKMWQKNIQDDPVLGSNVAGTISYAATSEPNSRTTQVFINFADNSGLDELGFAPFGRVVVGLDVAMAVHNPTPGQGGGVDQQMYKMKGNDWIREQYPGINFIQNASLRQANATLHTGG